MGWKGSLLDRWNPLCKSLQVWKDGICSEKEEKCAESMRTVCISGRKWVWFPILKGPCLALATRRLSIPPEWGKHSPFWMGGKRKICWQYEEYTHGAKICQLRLSWWKQHSKSDREQQVLCFLGRSPHLSYHILTPKVIRGWAMASSPLDPGHWAAAPATNSHFPTSHQVWGQVFVV